MGCKRSPLHQEIISTKLKSFGVATTLLYGNTNVCLENLVNQDQGFEPKISQRVTPWGGMGYCVILCKTRDRIRTLTYSN